ncbi:uncharacterized protein LOC106051079 [Biomphalaria glabrata]|uniref:Uncharacterized protein LOC106051079 n=1 Tax=Biomphalaria glabrata TaxID=6526 RepID=A0A9U8DUF4_BIOGL|nr:uncharacterized protein LOC106051079 [Biomphalaria glabrata]
MPALNGVVCLILCYIGGVLSRDRDVVPTYSCHLRLGSNEKQILHCPPGHALHIHSLLCSGQYPCPSELFDSIYHCEGVPSCDISNLKLDEQQTSTIDYVCVSEVLLERKCSAQLHSYFGILRRPESDSRKRNLKSCNWALDASKEDIISIIFHYASWHNDCQNAVNISYTHCNTKKWQNKMFCGMEPSSVKLTSCGPVKISSRQAIDASWNYVISYQKQGPQSGEQFSSNEHDSRSSTTCILPDTLNPRIPSPSKFQKLSPSQEPTSNQNFEPSDGIINFIDPTDHKDNSSQSGSIFNKPKLIILYVFFGIIILVLSVALIAVLISYYRLSKEDRCSGDASEKAALWQDTPMETFLTNSLADGSVGSETIYPLTQRNNSDQIVATVHSDSVYETDDFDHRLSSGSGISTFLSGKQVSDMRDLIHTFQTGNFIVYDDLNQHNSSDQADIGYYQSAGNEDIYEDIRGEEASYPTSNNNNRQSSVPKTAYPMSERNSKEMSNPCRDRRISPSPDNFHYCINDDEYAIVHKTSKPHNDKTQQHNSEEFPMLAGSVDFRPTAGPYDRSRNSAVRFSKEEKWKDNF